MIIAAAGDHAVTHQVDGRQCRHPVVAWWQAGHAGEPMIMGECKLVLASARLAGEVWHLVGNKCDTPVKPEGGAPKPPPDTSWIKTE